MAAKDGPRVLCVRSEVHDDGKVSVSIGDTGTGIDQRDVDRIFNPLFTTKSDGMGMGLSICRSIIEAHDGRLWVSPNKPEGAIFQFALLADGPNRREIVSEEVGSSGPAPGTNLPI
jgi:signal transduction histidine kinase